MMIRLVSMCLLLCVFAMALQPLSASAIRYDAMDIPSRPIVATGLELRGEVDGGRISEWDTSTEADGWVTVQSANQYVKVLVLNTPVVAGGRLVADETWNADRTYVVRDDVIVPNGVALTLAAGVTVKFVTGARVLVEPGGTLCCRGAQLADFADDSVGGDTNMDGNETEPSGGDWWRDEPAVGQLATIAFLDGARTIFPSRSYTIGIALADLPQPVSEGSKFVGWFTAPEGAGEEVTETYLASGSMTAYAFWQPLSLGIEPSATNMAPVAAEGFFAVTANPTFQENP